MFAQVGDKWHLCVWVVVEVTKDVQWVLIPPYVVMSTELKFHGETFAGYIQSVTQRCWSLWLLWGLRICWVCWGQHAYVVRVLRTARVRVCWWRHWTSKCVPMGRNFWSGGVCEGHHLKNHLKIIITWRIIICSKDLVYRYFIYLISLLVFVVLVSQQWRHQEYPLCFQMRAPNHKGGVTQSALHLLCDCGCSGVAPDILVDVQLLVGYVSDWSKHLIKSWVTLKFRNANWSGLRNIEVYNDCWWVILERGLNF